MRDKRALDNPTEVDLDTVSGLRERAISALRTGRFDLAEDLLTKGEVSLSALVENLRIYQAELEIQNEELIAAQQDGLQALARFTAFFNTLPIAELVLDTYGLVLEANPEARQLLGLRRSLAHQYFFTRLLSEPDRERVVGTWFGLAEGESAVIPEVRFRSSDGHGFIGDLHIARLPPTHREPSRFVCAVLDRSEAVEQRLREIESAYAKARASEEQYRTLFEAASEGIAIVRQGRYVAVNPAALAMLGYAAAEEVIGKHPGELAPAVQPDGESSISKASRMSALALEQGPRTFEWSCLHRDGHCVPIRVTLTPVRILDEPALLVTWRDLTDEQLAREHEQLAQTVFDNTAEGILIMDAELRILAVNPAFTKITGYSRDESLGKSLPELGSDLHDESFHQGVREALAASGHWRGELWSLRKSGERYPQLTAISAVTRGDGAQTGYVCVLSDITLLKQAEDALKHQAHHDSLTGLPNRVLIRAHAERALRRAEKRRGPLALLFLDLDHFKRVNDTLGHRAGDLLLRDVATTLAGRLRAGDLIARIGGDEFVVLMDELLSLADAEGLARRLISVFETPFRIMDQDCHIGVSIGISHYPHDGEDFETLLSRADMAMYHAKQSGRHTFRWFEPAMAEEARVCMRIDAALQDALQRNELSLEYQPIVRLSDGTLSAVLVHSRWRDPELGEIPASRFMRRADEAGLGGLLGSWMLARACREIAGWDAAGVAVPRVSVNLSTRWLDREQTLDELQAILKQAQTTAERLDIEIDESALREPSASLVANLNALCALGVTLTVGQFGCGLAALSDLRRLPVRRVKLQESLLSELMGDAPDERMANALIGLARALDLRILVEGVASAAQADALRRMGYDEVLGPWSGCPSPAASWPSGAVVPPPDDQA